MLIRAQFLVTCLLLYSATAEVASAAPPAAYLQEREGFIAEMAQKLGMERPFLEETVGRAHYKQKIIDAMNRPAEAKPWRDYRPIFLTSGRIEGGVKFWREHAESLARAQRTYGVPEEIIVAIIGVETLYGGNTGSYRVIDALSTLAFGYPKRARFFRGELEAFLRLVREEPVAPNDVKGSYAGAMGFGQFIPSSYRAYAVDFDGDGRRDLLGSIEDAIGSVANYLKQHGWRQGLSITSEADGVTHAHQRYLDSGMKPAFTLQELAEAGITPRRQEVQAERSSLIHLEGEGGDEYWLGLDNFYVITRYNHSNLYAMAVVQLSEAIRKAYGPPRH